MGEIPIDLEAKLIYELQCGLPIVPRPYAEIAEKLGRLNEENVLEFVKHCYVTGRARCLRGVFDLSSLGYESALCAVRIPRSDLTERADTLGPFSAITHCYERRCLPKDANGVVLKDLPNLWFTYTALKPGFDAEIEKVAECLAPYSLSVFPAIRQFKIQVIFDTRKESDGRPTLPKLKSKPSIVFSDKQKKVVKALKDIPVVAMPFERIALSCGVDHGYLLSLLKEWKNSGVLRRVGLIMHHRRIGFKANGMAVWKVGEGDIADVGAELARDPSITHCYERRTSEVFPYNLYAMMHAGDWETLNSLYDSVSKKLNLKDGLLFRSECEYKKTSFQPFEAR